MKNGIFRIFRNPNAVWISSCKCTISSQSDIIRKADIIQYSATAPKVQYNLRKTISLHKVNCRKAISPCRRHNRARVSHPLVIPSDSVGIKAKPHFATPDSYVASFPQNDM